MEAETQKRPMEAETQKRPSGSTKASGNKP